MINKRKIINDSPIGIFRNERIMITEIHWNPKGSTQGKDRYYEFIEIYNPHDYAVDITDWELTSTSSTGNEYVRFKWALCGQYGHNGGEWEQWGGTGACGSPEDTEEPNVSNIASVAVLNAFNNRQWMYSETHHTGHKMCKWAYSDCNRETGQCERFIMNPGARWVIANFANAYDGAPLCIDSNGNGECDNGEEMRYLEYCENLFEWDQTDTSQWEWDSQIQQDCLTTGNPYDCDSMLNNPFKLSNVGMTLRLRKPPEDWGCTFCGLSCPPGYSNDPTLDQYCNCPSDCNQHLHYCPSNGNGWNFFDQGPTAWGSWDGGLGPCYGTGDIVDEVTYCNGSTWCGEFDSPGAAVGGSAKLMWPYTENTDNSQVIDFEDGGFWIEGLDIQSFDVAFWGSPGFEEDEFGRKNRLGKLDKDTEIDEL